MPKMFRVPSSTPQTLYSNSLHATRRGMGRGTGLPAEGCPGLRQQPTSPIILAVETCLQTALRFFQELFFRGVWAFDLGTLLRYSIRDVAFAIRFNNWATSFCESGISKSHSASSSTISIPGVAFMIC